MEIISLFVFIVFIFAVFAMAFAGLMHMTDTWEVFIKYYILKECRHDYSKWAQLGSNGIQQRECNKCGWVERSSGNYR